MELNFINTKSVGI